MTIEKRKYSVFKKVDGKWVRLSTAAFRKSVAVRLFQDILLGGSMDGYEMALRVVNDDKDVLNSEGKEL